MPSPDASGFDAHSLTGQLPSQLGEAMGIGTTPCCGGDLLCGNTPPAQVAVLMASTPPAAVVVSAAYLDSMVAVVLLLALAVLVLLPPLLKARRIVLGSAVTASTSTSIGTGTGTGTTTSNSNSNSNSSRHSSRRWFLARAFLWKCCVASLTATTWCGTVAAAPTPAPTIVRDPDHEFDFRGCSDSSDTADTGVDGSGITATATNGATCSEEGMVFDGSDDYVDVTPWPFGGEAMTVEAYVKYDSFNAWSRIFCFADGHQVNQAFLSNKASTSASRQGSSFFFLFTPPTMGSPQQEDCAHRVHPLPQAI